MFKHPTAIANKADVGRRHHLQQNEHIKQVNAMLKISIKMHLRCFAFLYLPDRLGVISLTQLPNLHPIITELETTGMYEK